MNCFGYLSPSLSPEAFWKRWGNWLPEAWRYRRGPLFTGKLHGSIGSTFVEGWGWQIPSDYRRVWNEIRNNQIGQRMSNELFERRIKVIGIEKDEDMISSLGFNSPGVSDGRTLELIMFINDFINRLHQNNLTR